MKEPHVVQTIVGIFLVSVFGTLFVGLRLWTRVAIVRAPGWEDYLIVASWAFSVMQIASLQLHHGLGTHSAALAHSDVERVLFYIYLSIPPYCVSLGLTKLAILTQYKRVFTTHTFQIWAWAFIAFVSAYTVSITAVSIFTCCPMHQYWTIEPTEHTVDGRCINTTASWFFNAAMNIVTDLMIVGLPIPVVKSLNLKNKQKWLLIGVFGVGIVVCIISVIRLRSLYVLTHSSDKARENLHTAALSVLETHAALICACLPALRPLLAKWMSGLGQSQGNAPGGRPEWKGYSGSRSGRGVQLGSGDTLAVELDEVRAGRRRQISQ